MMIEFLLSCIVDTFGHTIGTARATSLMITSIAVRASNFIVKAMKKFRLRMIYQVLAVLCLVILFINVILAAIFVIVVSAIAYENIVPITVFVVVLWMYLPAIYVFCRDLLLGLGT